MRLATRYWVVINGVLMAVVRCRLLSSNNAVKVLVNLRLYGPVNYSDDEITSGNT